MINAPKGTKDILPTESYKWHYLEEKIRKITSLYNAKEIRTPMFESTELFLRGVGQSTDIVNKEMYTFLDKGNRSITLKPEGTAGVVRSYIENGLFNEAQPIKCYYISSIFRYERPQKGRLREHHQFGVEYFGTNSPLADAEVISIAVDFIKSLGIEKVSVNINSIGSQIDRENYKLELKDYFKNKLNFLCEDCKIRYDQNVLRLLDCKVDMGSEAVKGAPSILNSLSKESKEHFEQVKQLLDLKGIIYKINDKIVRGLDYYTGTVFEVIADDIKGPSKVICGGGRYNNLVEELGGKPTEAVGFGMGLERILMLLEEFNINIIEDKKVDAYIAKIGLENNLVAVEIVNELRKNGISCENDLVSRNLKAELKYASKINAQYAVIIGEDEYKQGKVQVKDMATSEEKLVALKDLVKYLLGELN